ncbi:D-serine ammonia-lyase [Alcaligenaceae bacterium]|nr:D-serine ammonia-lyase [Alcaligenaceae bacterium]
MPPEHTALPPASHLGTAEQASLQRREPMLWLNPAHAPRAFTPDKALDPEIAIARFSRCAALMSSVFPQLRNSRGRLQSPLVPVPALQRQLGGRHEGTWLIKRDDALPVAGSVKARGGFHEVLTLAERLALDGGLVTGASDRLELAGMPARRLFEKYTIAVGSTGNLGLSIGLIAKTLGFKAMVHMSEDAKEWKKDRLRAAGVEVIEHAGDYASAVKAGRLAAESDPFGYFVDDEESVHLFLGYAAAAHEIQSQLAQQGRGVDAEHPLFVYLPCGVGGAPGGVAYGLKRLFGEHVHCFFAEPAASPCMLVQLAARNEAPVSVYDYGLDNRTEADGLAVAQASPLVAPLMRKLLSGVFTVDDDTLFRDVHALMQAEGMLIEPSAAAGMRGPLWLTGSEPGLRYLASRNLPPRMRHATHIIWSTGGSLVPSLEHETFQKQGRQLSAPAAG